MSALKDPILTALEEARVEVRFRLEDVHKRREAPHPTVETSVAATLAKIERAIILRQRELKTVKDMLDANRK